MTEQELIEKGVPNHIAIILDGNGRWAKKRLMPRTYGHRKGFFNIGDIANYCNDIGVKYLTVYCFSTENWKRPKDEVDYLMTKPVRFFDRYKDKFLSSNIKLNYIGRKNRIPASFKNILDEVVEKTKDKTGLTLTLCLDYGSLDEISYAIKNIITDAKNNKIDVSDITEQTIFNYLYTKDIPNVDLMIRTSGEIRLSNFLLPQLAYAELYFTDVFWPDFNKEELYKAIENFQSRNRRFGGLKEAK